MIKQCNAITTKNEYSLYRKSRENRAEKKKWIGKINKITKKPSRGSFVKQTVGTVYLTEPGKGDVCTQNTFHLHVVVISRTDLGSLIAVISSTLQKPQQNRQNRIALQFMTIQYQLIVSKFKAAETYFHQRVVSYLSNNNAQHCK